MKVLRVSKDGFVLRLEKGDFVVEKILEFLEKEQIKAGLPSDLSLEAQEAKREALAKGGYLWIIGAVDKVKLALYELKTKTYFEKEFKGAREIASLSGFISTNKNKPHLHLHGVFCDKKFNCVGGHLKEAQISATGEVYLKIFDKKLTRYADKKIGLDLLSS